MGAGEGKPRSGTPLLDAELEKKRVAAAAAYSKDRKQVNVAWLRFHPFPRYSLLCFRDDY